MSGKEVSEKDICSYCGSQVPEGANFCPECGEPIKEVSEMAAAPIISGTPSGEELLVLYLGTIRGIVTGESKAIRAPLVGSPTEFSLSPYQGFAESQFVVKLEKNHWGVPDELLVQTKFGYFGIGDKVMLQGRILRKNLETWSRPMYTILADHYYNETLQIGDDKLTERKKVLYTGIIRGIVTREPKARIAKPYAHIASGMYKAGLFAEVCFVMKLEKGIEGVPDEILVRSRKRGYFRIGDEVTLQGRVVKEDLKLWNKPKYTVIAYDFLNEPLQIGSKEVVRRKKVSKIGIIKGLVTGESMIEVDSEAEFQGTLFAVKLEKIEGVPDDVLVKTKNLIYCGKGDKVTLQGRVVKEQLKLSGKPRYTILAHQCYNEILQSGDLSLLYGQEATRILKPIVKGGQKLYEGTIQGVVTRESTMRVNLRGEFDGTYFAVKLEGKMGIGEIPNEILVVTGKSGYFRKGDKVTLQGKILKNYLKEWERPSYYIGAYNFYNESLQIGDE